MKFTPKKNKIEKKRELTPKLPSHIPTKEVLKQVGLEEEEIKKAVLVDSFLKNHSLPQDKDRNMIACNFNDKGELVLLFDTGEKIITSPMNIKEYVEQYVTVQQEVVNNGGGSGDSVQEVFIGAPSTLPTYPALVFEETIVDGQTVYNMRVNVP